MIFTDKDREPKHVAELLLVLLTLLALVLWTSPTDASFDAGVKISVARSGAIRLPVTIDGAGPLTFLLDTGSSHSAVSSDVAERLALRAVARRDVITSTGMEMRLVVRLPKTAIGTAVAEGLLASVVPALQLRMTMPGVDGVIGQDFLSAFNYTLDYRGKRLIWTAEIADDGQDARLPLVRQEGRFLVCLPSNRDQRSVLLVPDSGTDGFVIYGRNGVTAFEMAPASSATAIFGLTGDRVNARAMTLRELRLGLVTLKNQRAVVVDRTWVDAPEGDGLLPLHLFASVSFNSREGYIIIKK